MPYRDSSDHIALRIDEHTIGGGWGNEYADLIQQHTATILLTAPGKADIPVGALAFGVVTSTPRVNMRDVCDAHSAMYYFLWDSLRNRHDHEFKPAVTRAIGPVPPYGNLLHIEKVEIAPRHRGQKLGLHALQVLFNAYARGCQAAFLQAHPFVLPRNVGRDYSNECRALRGFYAKLGFKRIGTSNFMGLNLAGTQKLR